MIFLKNGKLMIGGRLGQILHFVKYILLKIISGLKNPLGMLFDSKDSKMISKLPYNLLVLCCTMWCLYVKKKDVTL